MTTTDATIRTGDPESAKPQAAEGVGYFPVPLTLAALVAMFALYLTARTGQGLIVLGALLVLSYVVRWRIPHERIVRWTARIVPMCAITLLVGWPSEDIVMWYIKPAYTNLVGYLLATEIVIQAYLRRPRQAVVMNEALRDPVRIRESYGFVVLLTGGIMITAANTYDRSNMQMVVPAYALMVVLAIRSFARLSQPGATGEPQNAAAAPRRAVRWPLVALRTVAIGLALGLGFSAVYSVNKYERKITNWALDLLRQDRARHRGEIGLSATARLRATFNPEASLDRVLLIEGPQNERHLRALAYDTYADRLWRPTIREREFTHLRSDELATAREGQRLTFRRIGDTLGLLPLPLESVSIEPTDGVERDDDGVLQTADKAANLKYEAVVATAIGSNANPLIQPFEQGVPKRLLALPAGLDPKVVELAKEVAGRGPPHERVVRLTNHLRTNHQYSLSYQPEGEPLSDFILNRRAAHCQYFASALTVMARAAGVPARMVTGFYAHERDGDDTIVVRDRDAHAWAEVYLEGAGWVTMDATPATGRPDALFEEPSRWRRMWEDIADWPRAVQEWLASVGREAVLWFVLAISLVALGIWSVQRLLGARRRQRREAARAYATPSAELAEIARRFERVLAMRGVPVEANRTWREHLAALTARPVAGVDVARSSEFVNAYDEARFGGANGSMIENVRRLLQTLEVRR